jgi:DNA polymerase-1
MLAFYKRYGFKTWLRELSGDATAGATPLSSTAKATAGSGNTPAQAGLFNDDGAIPATVISNYETVLTEAQLDAWIARINAASLTAVDTETTSLEPMTAQLVGISLCCEAGHACYIPVAHQYADAPAQLSRDRYWKNSGRGWKMTAKPRSDKT